MVDRKEEKDTTRHTEQVEVDLVNNPPHYTTGRIECIDAMNAMSEGANVSSFVSYCWLASFKYIWRWHYKGKPIEDLEKAKWYIQRMIDKLKEELNETKDSN